MDEIQVMPAGRSEFRSRAPMYNLEVLACAWDHTTGVAETGASPGAHWSASGMELLISGAARDPVLEIRVGNN